MRPIYFPFTYVPQNVARALAAIFGSFIVYQPSGKKVPDEMQLWVEADVMEVRVPDQTNDQGFEKVVKDFRSFANLHSDSKNLKTAALLGPHGAIPFFNETSTSRIVADLKKGGSSASVQTGSDPLFCARVFLGFAQDFDRQGDELNRGLVVHAQQALELIKTLKGETEIDPAAMAIEDGTESHDPGDHMALARIQAWALLFQKDPVGSGLFVTSSKSVFNQLMAKVAAPEKILQSAGLPADEIKSKAFHAWRASFLKHLNRLAETHGSVPTTPRTAGGLDFAAKGVKRQGREVPRSLKTTRCETGAKSSRGGIWKTQSKDTGVDLSFDSAGGTNVRLTLYRVPGQIPGDFFARYLEARLPPEKHPDQKAKFQNTLVGLVEGP